VPFPRALSLARTTGATVLAGLPLEPIVLGEIARAEDLDVRRDTKLRTLFLGGSPPPPAMQRRPAPLRGARGVGVSGSTETMLLGTACAQGTLHLETELAYCEVVAENDGQPAPPGAIGRLVVTTLAVEGSPLVRLDTGDLVRPVPACACGDARLGVV